MRTRRELNAWMNSSEVYHDNDTIHRPNRLSGLFELPSNVWSQLRQKYPAIHSTWARHNEKQSYLFLSTRVGFPDIVWIHKKSVQVCGCCLSSCSVLKYWLENEKQDIRHLYTSQQYLRILLSCLRARNSDEYSFISILLPFILLSPPSGPDREGAASLRGRAGWGGRDKVPAEDGGVGQGRLLGLQAGQGSRRGRRGSHAGGN